MGSGGPGDTAPADAITQSSTNTWPNPSDAAMQIRVRNPHTKPLSKHIPSKLHRGVACAKRGLQDRL
eukprot:917072-Pyramimonas_sp.AAC.1